MSQRETNPFDLEKDGLPVDSTHSQNPFLVTGRNPARQHGANSIHTVKDKASSPFVGRLGANQAFAVDRNDEANRELVDRDPDAAPGMTLKEQMDLRHLGHPGLWKAAAIEGVGTMLLVFITVWANISAPVIPVAPDAQLGYFENAAYLGPLTGGLINFLVVTLFTFCFGAVSGAHLNPTITFATFLARLCTLPRMILYIGFQTLGATLAGFLVRAGYGGREFKVGGCWAFDDLVPVRDLFAIEFMACTALLFIAFGVGLDPRQRAVIPPALSPFLVGLGLGVISWSTGYARYGYGGASMNPARCFASFIGSHFPGWHWYQWVADMCACVLHAICYYLVPPGESAF